MSATAWTITIYYVIVMLGLTIAYSAWWITRKKEDHIWRWIFTCLGGLFFATIFWLSYWLGKLDAAWVVWLAAIACYGWFYIVLSIRTPSNLTRCVFAAFGVFVVGMCSYGGFASGARGWWGMAIPFYFVMLHTIYSLLVPD